MVDSKPRWNCSSCTREYKSQFVVSVDNKQALVFVGMRKIGEGMYICSCKGKTVFDCPIFVNGYVRSAPIYTRGRILENVVVSFDR